MTRFPPLNLRMCPEAEARLHPCFADEETEAGVEEGEGVFPRDRVRKLQGQKEFTSSNLKATLPLELMSNKRERH